MGTNIDRDQLAEDEYIDIRNPHLNKCAQECFKRGWDQAVNALRAAVDEQTPDWKDHWATVAADYLEE
jgi:hypothetical protein